jgi:hypothetical protein
MSDLIALWIFLITNVAVSVVIISLSTVHSTRDGKRGLRPVAREVQVGGQHPLWICTMSKTNILISPLKTCDTLPYLRATSAELGVIGNKGNTFTYLISFWPSWPRKGGVDINNDVTWRQTHWGWAGCQLALSTSTNALGLRSKRITFDECNL